MKWKAVNSNSDFDFRDVGISLVGIYSKILVGIYSTWYMYRYRYTRYEFVNVASVS